MRTLLRFLGAMALVLACVACGSTSTDTASDSDSAKSADSSSTPSSQPSASPSTSASGGTTAAALPGCDTVWRAGAKLDDRYYGCTATDGSTVQPKGTYCESGQYVVSYANRFYAPLGGTIKSSPDLQHDRAFQRQLKACTA